MIVGSGTITKRQSKEEGLAEECAGAGEEDEDESEGEETAEKSFVWENATWPHFQCLGHAQSSGEERGEVGAFELADFVVLQVKA